MVDIVGQNKIPQLFLYTVQEVGFVFSTDKNVYFFLAGPVNLTGHELHNVKWSRDPSACGL